MRVLPEGWSETTLGGKCLKIGSGSTPRGGNEAYKKEGISLIRSQNILDFYFSYRGLAFIDELQASKLSNSNSNYGKLSLVDAFYLLFWQSDLKLARLY